MDKALSKSQRAEVATLSSRAHPSSRRVSFSYNVEGYDIPNGWLELMRKYYDVMYREDYGWWDFAMAFEASNAQINDLGRYELDGGESLNITIHNYENRVIILIGCRLEDAYIDDIDGDLTNDSLLNLFVEVRRQLMQGDYRTLYYLWETYGFEHEYDEEYYPPTPHNRCEGSVVVEKFIQLMSVII